MRKVTQITGYQINGIKYDSGTIDKELNQILQNNQDYIQRRDSLIQLYNSSYDICESNIDSYLDWHYLSFPEDPVGFASRTIDNIFDKEKAKENDLKEYQSRLTLNVDSGKIEADANAYNQIIWNTKDQLQNQLLSLSFHGIPGWLIYEEKSFDEYFQTRCVNPTFQIDFPEGEYADREALKQGILDVLQRDRNYVINTLKLNQ